MTASELEEMVWAKAKEFGILTQELKEEENRRGTPNARRRSNLNFSEGKAYFGYVSSEEGTSGAYYDLSFVVFPQEKNGKCVVSVCVGSAGYQRDYDLASTAGTRRMFTLLAENDGYSFIKNDFTDIESSVKDLMEKVAEEEDLNPLQTVIGTYAKVLLASRVVDPDTENGLNVIFAWLAQYAKLRNWGTKAQIKEQNRALKPYLNNKPVDIQKDIQKLLKNRRFVVLQGAPGTGKTYNALKISESEEYAETHFIQFHAETTYSDFVEGIRPKLDDTKLSYETTKGELVNAIETALKPENRNKRVLLIIDEINRANLANVLGPVFYLFEDQAGTRKVKLKVAGKELDQLPKNLDVIATMNTADRSLAVVDFALRRRFAWYTIRPQEIKADEGHVFHGELFARFCEVFDRYATDDELNLQPGPSYFLTSKEEADELMKDRMVYELMPLIKEYLAEGLMHKAADSFAQLFYEETGKYLYE
ncbi:MAG: AAA family ATPase [Prevotellaceae bacterium]|nr:AAA family ATPase [Prevotellaceae bacterium]